MTSLSILAASFAPGLNYVQSSNIGRTMAYSLGRSLALQNPFGDVPDQSGVLGGIALVFLVVIAWFLYALFKKH